MVSNRARTVGLRGFSRKKREGERHSMTSGPTPESENAEELLLVRSLIDQAPIARAKLWNLVYQQQRALGARLAEKLDLPEDDLTDCAFGATRSSYYYRYGGRAMANKRWPILIH